MSEIADKLPEVTKEEYEKFHDFNKEILEEFLQQQHLSPQTLRQYESALKIFFRFVFDKCKNLPLYELKPKHALQYQNFLLSRDLSSNAVKLKRSAVSSLCGYLEVYYSDEYPLFRNIYNKKIPNPPKALRHEKKPLAPDELNYLITELEKREEWQMIAYIQFSYDSGCRRSETAQLLKEVVNYTYVKDQKTGEEKKHYLTHNIRAKGRGKNGKVRKLMFGDISKDAIKKWLEVRGDDDCPYVFVKKTKTGKLYPLSPSAFNDWCTNTFSEIMGRRVHPHQLRSSRATNLVAHEGKDIEKVKKLLGHLSSETTKIYVVKEGEDEVDDLF
ncbi:tyrosine-type recombinase/integrase [Paenibacillus ehimensis]|uniref:tyrosine-type recombinase/integrase n=1 Tax=Paenibacillus ehimensis TaxID=79264 RepID=UPI002DBFDBC6|nr:tyrosine-type recombinase/integrase [Paenibacillus ehimensis]MEC0210240.1 tyrosine-type recombinase/integrase [Paenibacillus ehimensis]